MEMCGHVKCYISERGAARLLKTQQSPLRYDQYTSLYACVCSRGAGFLSRESTRGDSTWTLLHVYKQERGNAVRREKGRKSSPRVQKGYFLALEEDTLGGCLYTREITHSTRLGSY